MYNFSMASGWACNYGHYSHRRINFPEDLKQNRQFCMYRRQLVYEIILMLLYLCFPASCRSLIFNWKFIFVITLLGIRIFFRNVETRYFKPHLVRQTTSIAEGFIKSLTNKSIFWCWEIEEEKFSNFLKQKSFKFIEKLHILNTEFRGNYFENNSYHTVV